MPTSTDLPSLAIATRRKMFSSFGNVPATETRSQMPLVAIRASVGGGNRSGRRGRCRWRAGRPSRPTRESASGDVHARRDDRAGVCGRWQPAGTGCAGRAWRSRRGRRRDRGEGAGVTRRPSGVVDSCWTNGSLLLKRPNETSWSEPRSTTTWSGVGSARRARPAQRAVAGTRAPVVGATAWLPSPPIILGSWKPRTASRTTDLTARIFFWRRTRFSASDLTDRGSCSAPPWRREARRDSAAVLDRRRRRGGAARGRPTRDGRCGAVAEDVGGDGQRGLDLREARGRPD